MENEWFQIENNMSIAGDSKLFYSFTCGFSFDWSFFNWMIMSVISASLLSTAIRKPANLLRGKGKIILQDTLQLYFCIRKSYFSDCFPAIGVQVLDCRRNVRSIWNLHLKQGNLEGCRKYNIFCIGYSSTNEKAISLPIWSVLQIACTQSSPAKHTWTQTLTLTPPFWLLLLPSLFE